ncbi:TRAP transporter substrate-binding protein DctP [Minwuia thermotolerans]|uniref:C4-dicarboxylate ABC transporter substrate-binding protein n=1 Tax=Minwuia thermotolerans TaxID=2056226 RepID=A0A2M9FXK6_9PROT|nr:TRAP transporter substrate-binding protein DctP [Minwuia thermotolerans]PJK28187.1 hypothetical protein CVT23_17565 [Minwuia thermotolerans]
MLTRFLMPAIGAVLALSVSVAAAKELRFAHQFPTSHFAVKLVIDPFAAGVAEKTGGELTMKIFPAEQLAKASGLLDAVRNRVADVAFVGVTYVTEKMPLTSVVELPGLVNNVARGYHAFQTVTQERIAELEHQPQGVKPIFVALTPPYQFVLRDTETLDSVDQLAGKKLRVPGATGALAVESVGGVAVQIPSSDLYVGLDRGTVDGAISTSASVNSLKLNEVTDLITTNAAMGTVAFVLFVNSDVWEELSESQRAAVQEVGTAVGAKGAAVMDGVVDKAYKALGDAGMNVVAMPDPMVAELNGRLKAVETKWLEDVGARNPAAGEILKRFKALLAE